MQYNSILDIHSHQTNQTKQREEIKLIACKKQTDNDTNKYQRSHQQDDKWITEIVEQQQQHDKNQHQRQRHILPQSRIGLRLRLLLTKELHLISRRHNNLLLDLTQEIIQSTNGIHSIAGVTLRLHHALTIVSFHNAKPKIKSKTTCRLLDGIDIAPLGEYRHRLQIGEVEVRYIVILQQDGHNLVILTERPHRIAVGGKGYPLRHTTATHTYSLTLDLRVER